MSKPARIAIVLILASTTALAHGGVTDKNVMARMEGMSSLKAAVKALAEMAKGARPFDQAAAGAALAHLAEEAARIPALFEQQALTPKSEARAIIWDEFDRFSAMADDLGRVSDELVQQVSTRDDLPVALQKIGETCKSCHTDYRK